MKEPPRGIQQWIYILEEGSGRIWVRRSLLITVAIALAGLFHLNRSHNFESPEAMDMAQLGRNLAEGRGFTTWNIRPLSVALQTAVLTNSGKSPFQLLQKPHTDISNPPVYPVMLAGVLKVIPASFRNSLAGKNRSRPAPEVAIGFLNLLGMGALAFMVYRTAWGMFSPGAAIIASLVLLTSELYWDFVFSGLPTLWLAALLCWIAWLTASAPDFLHGRAAGSSARPGFWRGALIGGLLGLSCLTVYSTGWLIVPVSAALYLSARHGRRALTAGCVAAFLVVVAPWITRNVIKSGMPFGTATVAAYSRTKGFPGDRLERSLAPDLKSVEIYELYAKYTENERDLLTKQLPTAGGTWFAAFFFAGIFLPSRSPLASRMKWLLFSMLLVFVLVQPVIQTRVSKLCPVYNMENLVVLLAPLAIVMAAGTLEDIWSRTPFPFAGADTIAKVFLVVLCAFPGVQVALRSRRNVLASPPYIPTVITQLAGYIPADALMMSDMPWGVAWYGRHVCVDTTLRVRENYREDFFTLNDYHRSIRALYLSPITANREWQPGFVADPDGVWGRLYMDFFLRGKVPEGFPLKFAFGGGEGANAMAYPSAGHLLMADFQYW